MAYLGFREFPNLIEYYTTISNSTKLQAGNTTIENGTLLEDINNFMYLTQLYFKEDTHDQILNLLSTLVLWSKSFYTTIGQYPTLYEFLVISPKEISCSKYYLAYPGNFVKPNIFLPTLHTELYSGEMSHHMHDSGESQDVSVCHTINMTSLSICQLHDSSVCQHKCDSTWNCVHQSVCPSSVSSVQPSAKYMVSENTNEYYFSKFPYVQNPERFLSIYTSSDSSVDPPGSPSVSLSLSAENPSK